MQYNIAKYTLTTSALIVAAAAQAAPIYGLTTRDQLISFDSATPNTINQAVFITGLATNESLVGIDYRPSTKQLYGLGSSGRLYKVNQLTGQSSFVASLFNSSNNNPISLSGSEFGVDFNPVANRLRVTSNLGQNLRINVDTGATIVDGMLNEVGGPPRIVASAYTNNFAGATSTTLYNIDSNSDQLKIQNPPNAGGQVVVGSLGYDVSALAGFDISTVNGKNTAYAALQMANGSGSQFATIDLATGNATLLGSIGLDQSSDSFAIRDIAAPVPEPASMAILGLGALALLRRRRSK